MWLVFATSIYSAWSLVRPQVLILISLKRLWTVPKKWMADYSILKHSAGYKSLFSKETKMSKIHLYNLGTSFQRCIIIIITNPLLQYSDTRFYVCCSRRHLKNIMTKEEIAPATMFSKLSNFKNVHFFQQSEHSRFF